MVTPAFSIEELDHRPRPEWPLFPHVVLSYMIRPNTILLVQREHTELFQLLPDGPGPLDLPGQPLQHPSPPPPKSAVSASPGPST